MKLALAALAVLVVACGAEASEIIETTVPLYLEAGPAADAAPPAEASAPVDAQTGE